MQRSVTATLVAALAAVSLVACGGGKSSSSSSTTTTAASPAASPASSMAAASPAASKAGAMSGAMKGSMGGAATAAAGEKVFITNCSSCHQANGKGQPGVFPPLAGNAVVTGSPAAVIHIVKDGLTGKVVVAGTTYNGTMPPWKSTLSASDIAAVITYVRSAWGNHAGPVTVTQVSSTP